MRVKRTRTVCVRTLAGGVDMRARTNQNKGNKTRPWASKIGGMAASLAPVGEPHGDDPHAPRSRPRADDRWHCQRGFDAQAHLSSQGVIWLFFAYNTRAARLAVAAASFSMLSRGIKGPCRR